MTLVGRGPQIMKGVASTDALAYSERIAKAGMTVCTNTTPLEIVDGGVMVKFKGKVRKIEADTVVYAFGAAAQHALYDELKGSGKEVYLVGDAKGPAKIMDAIYNRVQAFHQALNITSRERVSAEKPRATGAFSVRARKKPGRAEFSAARAKFTLWRSIRGWSPRHEVSAPSARRRR